MAGITTIFKVFGMTRLMIKPATSRNRVKGEIAHFQSVFVRIMEKIQQNNCINTGCFQNYNQNYFLDIILTISDLIKNGTLAKYHNR